MIFLFTQVWAEEPSWDVAHMPGETTWVQIDTNEVTWASVDVSHDGTKMVFDLLGDIYLLDIDGGEAKAITSGMAWDMQPCFSPDDSSIAFTSDRGGGDNIWVYALYETDSTDKQDKFTQITKESFRLLNSPVWSPDGRYLLARKHFTAGRSLGTGEIWLYDIQGGSGIALTSKPNEQTDVGEPAFSIEGRYVYYSKDASGNSHFAYNKDPNSQIYAVYRLDTHTGDITEFTRGIRPTPSPILQKESGQSEYIAFVRRNREKTVLMIKDPVSGQEWQIADNLSKDLQETWAIHGVYPHIAWMPNGQELVYWAQGKIWRVSISEKRPKEIPFHIQDKREIREALRFPVQDIDSSSFAVKAIRHASISPTGKQIVFEALGEIWLYDISTKRRKSLGSIDDGFAFDPSWSADGSAVFFSQWNDMQFGTVHKISLQGLRHTNKILAENGHFRQPVESDNFLVYQTTGAGFLRNPMWSDDGMWVHPKTAANPPFKIDSTLQNMHFDNQGMLLGTRRQGDYLQLVQINLHSKEEHIIAQTEMGTGLWLSPNRKHLYLLEEHRLYAIDFIDTGKKITVSKQYGELPIASLSVKPVRSVYLSPKGISWVEGSSVYEWSNEDKVATEIANVGFTYDNPTRNTIFALEHVRILTMTEGAESIIDNGTVVWQGNRILDVGTNVAIPKNAIRLDGTGKTVMPGFVDVHHHGAQDDHGIIPQQNWKNLSALSFGVTTVHDPSANTEVIFTASELQKSHRVLAPRIFSTGTILYGAKSPGASVSIDSLEDAEFHVQRMQEIGAFSLKSYNLPRREQRQQVLVAAKKHQMMVVPEGGSLLMHNLTQIVDGHTGVEHAIPVAPLYGDVLQLWSQTHVGYTPTLGVAYGGLMGENYWYAKTDVWKNERLATYVPQSILDAASRRANKVPEDEYHHIDVARSATELLRRGTSVQLGAHGQREGLAVHWELWMLSQGGMTPIEALQVGTINSARYLGLDHELGSIEKGKLADMIVIDGNPLDDIYQSEHVLWTILDGRVYDAFSLEELHTSSSLHRTPLFFQQHPALGEHVQEETLHCSCQH